jgi:voltage-gated potassium channel Kch
LAPPGSAAAASVVTTNQITINAANMTPQEMVTELERHLARSKDDALYDSATSAGQYGGGL